MRLTPCSPVDPTKAPLTAASRLCCPRCGCSLCGRRHLPGHFAESVEPHLRCVGHPDIHPGKQCNQSRGVNSTALSPPRLPCRRVLRCCRQAQQAPGSGWCYGWCVAAPQACLKFLLLPACPSVPVAAVGPQPQLASKLRGGLRGTRHSVVSMLATMQAPASRAGSPTAALAPSCCNTCPHWLPQAARLYNEDRKEYNRRVKGVVEASWADDGEDDEEGDEEEA